MKTPKRIQPLIDVDLVLLEIEAAFAEEQQRQQRMRNAGHDGQGAEKPRH